MKRAVPLASPFVRFSRRLLWLLPGREERLEPRPWHAGPMNDAVVFRRSSIQLKDMF